MNVADIVYRFERIGGVAGKGPRHPHEPEPAMQAAISDFLDTYPALRGDRGYIDFLETYAGGSLNTADMFVDILGFGDASSNMLDFEGSVVDDDGFLMFAQCIYYVLRNGDLSGTYEHAFAFAVLGGRPSGVYRKVTDADFPEGGPWEFYCEDFCQWLERLVDVGGRFERQDAR
jgi:hypothetical protein